MAGQRGPNDHTDADYDNKVIDQARRHSRPDPGGLVDVTRSLGHRPRVDVRGQVSYGGKWVVNPSGGLISKGHPLGATGLAQCSELHLQLRGEAGSRQVDDVDLALQHNIGLGGAAVVTLYRRAS